MLPEKYARNQVLGVEAGYARRTICWYNSRTSWYGGELRRVGGFGKGTPFASVMCCSRVEVKTVVVQSQVTQSVSSIHREIYSTSGKGCCRRREPWYLRLTQIYLNQEMCERKCRKQDGNTTQVRKAISARDSYVAFLQGVIANTACSPHYGCIYRFRKHVKETSDRKTNSAPCSQSLA